eukprot:366015-Chlamydomonas_euryale.AAC.3
MHIRMCKSDAHGAILLVWTVAPHSALALWNGLVAVLQTLSQQTNKGRHHRLVPALQGARPIGGPYVPV